MVNNKKRTKSHENCFSAIVYRHGKFKYNNQFIDVPLTMLACNSAQ